VRVGGGRFVRLLLAAVQEYEEQYRIVVITMRSDYLGRRHSSQPARGAERASTRAADDPPAAAGKRSRARISVASRWTQISSSNFCRRRGRPRRASGAAAPPDADVEVEEMNGSARMRMAHLERVGVKASPTTRRPTAVWAERRISPSGSSSV
jgi:hypothetical protein